MAELPVLAAILSRLFETSKYVVVEELLISHWSNFQSSDEHSLALLCFALVRFFIGSGNSLHRLDQSDAILEPIAKCSLSSSLKFFRFQKAFREKKKRIFVMQAYPWPFLVNTSSIAQLVRYPNSKSQELATVRLDSFGNFDCFVCFQIPG